jgi:hypothetical protein
MLQLGRFFSSPKWKAAADIVNLVGSIIGVAAVLLGAVQYFFNLSIFYNPTPDYLSRYNADVVPMLFHAGDFIRLHGDESAKNPEAFPDLVRQFVKERELQNKLSLAVGDLEDIIDCQQSYLCRLDGYDRLEPTIRAMWFDYRPALEDMRGNPENLDFAKLLESEAKRILARDRQMGKTPSL